MEASPLAIASNTEAALQYWATVIIFAISSNIEIYSKPKVANPDKRHCRAHGAA
jgi:hypothetical protein